MAVATVCRSTVLAGGSSDWGLEERLPDQSHDHFRRQVRNFSCGAIFRTFFYGLNFYARDFKSFLVQRNILPAYDLTVLTDPGEHPGSYY